MGFRSKKNRVHPSGNKKKQQRKERKRRRLARLVQKINPFSCCVRDTAATTNANVVDVDNSKEETQLTESLVKDQHPPSPAQGVSLSSKAAPPVTQHVDLNRCSMTGKSPAHPSGASTRVTISPSDSRVSLTPSVGSDSSSDEDDDCFYPPKSHSKFFLPVKATWMANFSGYRGGNGCRAPPHIRQSKAAKSFIATNYQPTSIGIQGDLMPHVISFPSINAPLHQRLPYCQMVRKALAYLSDSDEPDDSKIPVPAEESDSFDEFDDCFKSTEGALGLHRQPRDNIEIASCKEHSRTHQDDKVISDEATDHDEKEDQYYEGEPCTSPEKDVEYFPGEEDTYLPVIETSLRCIRGWLLPPNVHQRAVQPEPPFALVDDKPIMSSTINHALIVISYYNSKLQSGLSFRGKECPYFVEGMFRSVIKHGNTVHLENYDHAHEVGATEALALLKTKYGAWRLQWDAESATDSKQEEEAAQVADDEYSTGRPMDMYCPLSQERSLAYYISKLDVNACEALMFTFKGESMVFVPTGDGRVLLMDQHAHDDMDGGAIIAVCPQSIVPIQDMLNDYHLEYHESNDREGTGIRFSYMST